MSPSFFQFMWQQWRTVPPVPLTTDLTGKTVIVIGANTGIGFEAAKHFATMNPGKLILGCRSRERGELAVSKLKTETGYNQAELSLIDLAEFSSVKAFVERFEKEGGRLDYLVLNAGIATGKYAATVDGYESTIQVNCLAPSLLALLLLPRMVETAKNESVTPRIVVVSSGMHHWTTFDDQVVSSQSPLKVLGSKEYCMTEGVMGRRYADSKLINLFFVRALSDRLKTGSIVVNAVDPGFCVSELRRNVSGLRLIVFYVMDALIAWTAEQGSRNIIVAALEQGSDGKEDSLHGAYVSNFQVAEQSEFVVTDRGKKVQETLWEATLDILSKVDTRVPAIAEKFLS